MGASRGECLKSLEKGSIPWRVNTNPNPFCSCAQTAKVKRWPSRRSGTPRGTLSAWTAGPPVSARGQRRGLGGRVVRGRWRMPGCPCCLRGRSRPLHSLPRPHVGQFEPGRTHLHRVFWHSPEPGHTPVPRSLAGLGRLASGADPGADGHWQRHGQPRVGERHTGPYQTHAGLFAVRVTEGGRLGCAAPERLP